MKVLTTREMRNNMKSYFEMAETERISIKRGKKYVNLVVSDDPGNVFVDEKWIEEFMSIPSEFRCNPFEISPSGDLFWADKRNVDKLKEAVEDAGKGELKTMTPELRDELFGDL